MSNTKMTIEELLEEALVPEEEQSYELPDNWVWVKTETVNEIVTGSTPPKKNENYYGGDFPFIKPADLEQGNQVTNASEYLTKEGKMVSRIIPRDSTLVCCIGSIGKVGFSRVESTTNQQINSLIPNKCILNPKFNYYQVLNSDYQNQLWKRSSATTISIINKSKMSEIPMVLPPLNEQNRIAEKVERLLNKIEEAKELIEEAKQTFELRRAAILDKAFRGELTRNWRNTKYSPMENSNSSSYDDKMLYPLPYKWNWVKLETVCDKITDGTHHSPKSYPVGDYKYITAKNIKEHGIVLDDITYVSEEVHREIYSRCDVNKGDVLYIKDGATTGVATVNQLSEEFSLLSSVGVLRTKKDVMLPEYLMYCLNSPSTKRRMLGMMSGNAIRRLTLSKIKQGLIPLAPIEEQRVIVNILGKIESINIQLASSLNNKENIENLKQSILSKAFRGELGTNDPSDESAIELLKEVLQE